MLIKNGHKTDLEMSPRPLGTTVCEEIYIRTMGKWSYSSEINLILVYSHFYDHVDRHNFQLITALHLFHWGLDLHITAWMDIPKLFGLASLGFGFWAWPCVHIFKACSDWTNIVRRLGCAKLMRSRWLSRSVTWFTGCKTSLMIQSGAIHGISLRKTIGKTKKDDI